MLYPKTRAPEKYLYPQFPTRLKTKWWINQETRVNVPRKWRKNMCLWTIWWNLSKVILMRKSKKIIQMQQGLTSTSSLTHPSTRVKTRLLALWSTPLWTEPPKLRFLRNPQTNPSWMWNQESTKPKNSSQGHAPSVSLKMTISWIPKTKTFSKSTRNYSIQHPNKQIRHAYPLTTPPATIYKMPSKHLATIHTTKSQIK